MKTKSSIYYAGYNNRTFDGPRKKITYSFNDFVQVITGVVEDKGDLIYLYEYRGKYVGTEFFISFSRSSSSYKLLAVEDLDELAPVG